MADATLTGTAGSQPGQSSQQATTPAPQTGAASTPTGSEQRPFSTPADDWQAKYSELEKEHSRYKEYGDPDTIKSQAELFRELGATPQQVRQWIAWAQQTNADIQAGKLRAYDPSAERKEPAQPTDPYEGWDELTPQDQARRLTQIVSQQVAQQVKPEVEKFGSSSADFQKQLDAKMQLYMIAAQLAGQHPDVPFEDMITEATKLAAQSPAELLRQAVNAKLAPKRQQAEIEKMVAQKVSEFKAEQEAKENERLTAPFRPSPRLRMPDKTPRAERRASAFSEVVKAIRGGKS